MGIYTIVQAKDHLSRLIDEALRGEPVTITRHGKPVASLLPARREPRPMTFEDVAELRRRRESRPKLPKDSVTMVREMRDEEA